MSDRLPIFVALLRGINVGGRNKISMARLRAICEGLGCEDVHTYIQSGNVVFASRSSARALDRSFERAIEREYGVSIHVVVRSASAWTRYVNGNPFPNEAEREGSRVVLLLSKRRPQVNAVSDLERRAVQGERVEKGGGAIWIHYANGIGRSKLTPAALDRHVGSPVTARNWRTVLKLREMAREATMG